jgi:NAD(P)H-quinone oxidoreductase subunit 5
MFRIRGLAGLAAGPPQPRPDVPAMNDLSALVLILPPLALLTIGLVPGRPGRGRPEAVAALVAGLAGSMTAAAALVAVGVGLGAASWRPLPEAAWASLRWDGAACLMLGLVGLVGWVVARYARRTVAGDATADLFQRRIALTLGAVGVFVLAGNLGMMLAAWSLASVGLRGLLLHESDRPGARRGAGWMALVSRVGDIALVIAAVLVLRRHGTLDLTAIHDLAAAAGSDTPATNDVRGIAWLLVIGCGIKTALVPFHFWLPETLEAPTPVSALMHAGVVNAGGYALIRTAPLVSPDPSALAGLVAVGGLTACLGGLMMAAQANVKRQLAFSTIAQMGLMMLQCGLGGFAAAMLHILAHSGYKAHAFLTHGEALERLQAQRLPQLATVAAAGPFAGGLRLLAAGCIASVALVIGLTLVGVSPAAKPGGWVLAAVLALGLARWLDEAFARATGPGSLAAVGLTLALGLAYAAAYRLVDLAIGPVAAVASGPAPLIAAGVVAVLGVVLLAERGLLPRAGRWGEAVRIHATNGFYVEALARRLARNASG